MQLSELMELQREFDSQHKGSFEWCQKVTNENPEILEFLFMSMVGEMGEAANILKKSIRGDYELEDVRESLSEEIADIFIYLMKIAIQWNVDIEKEYLKKLDKNKKRFTCYEKDGVNQ